MTETHGFVPDPDGSGWHVHPAAATGRFADIFGEVRVRIEGPTTVRMRLTTSRAHSNILDTVHGGFLLALVDQTYFVAPMALGIEGALYGVTIDSATQFLAPVTVGEPMDAVVEVLRETGRMIFMRGLIEQNGAPALAFSGTIRKASAR